MRNIYLDHAATTPIDPRVLEAMQPYLSQHWGNPSSLHRLGQKAKAAMEEARQQVAQLISARPEEVVFTSSGTEADNWALKSAVFAYASKGNHIIISSIEHSAILYTAEFLEKRMGVRVTRLPVDEYGKVDPDDLRQAITKETILISIMHANNEVGTIQDIPQLSAIAREYGICFHTDAVQTTGSIPVNVNELGADMLSLSGHKLYGPKGVGALYVRKGTRLVPFIHGGEQERRRRGGTENIPGIVGLGAAAQLAGELMAEETPRLVALRERLKQGILERIEDVQVNGHPTERLPNNLNVCFLGAEGEAVLVSLDNLGICASSGSACTAGSLEPSHVLLAMGVPEELARDSVRFTLGRENKPEDIEHVLEVLPPVVERIREVSVVGSV